MLNSIKQYPKSSAVITLSSLVALSSIITAVVNYAKPECTKSLVNLLGGEKGFALAVTLIASTFLAIAAAGIACIAVSHNKDKKYDSLSRENNQKINEIKKLKNNPINKSIAEIEKIELTLEKDDLSVTGDNLDKLIFDNNGKSQVVTENDETLTLTKEEVDGKASYTVTDYKEKEGNEIISAQEIKDKLFDGNSEEPKKITVFPKAKFSKLQNIVVKDILSRVTRS
ncbi:MAG: hypothetical protein sL5_02660 [Candidatus Mesenet longicola]|uniref:Uncharacterized protein n=1 Tax=Candidatus Mesenet longicola TaxID=1892558 RepID=A0A8J3HS49_9RICK|nr:MAG: hypothetical protein sGL2_02350 [Candidatus Mesenet longicola]GHM59273.1 MAG: hypothetical protein sL5_02660 [Candidatus Mesenet longicola]